MSAPTRFRVRTLRYIPDVTTGEFLNVGIGLVCPETGWWDVSLARRMRGFKRVFPNAHPEALARALKQIQKEANRRHKSDPEQIDFVPGWDATGASSFLGAVLGDVEGALQWSAEEIDGVTTDPATELEYWFHRLVQIRKQGVARAESPEDKLLTAVEREFSSRGILEHFQPAEVGTYVKQRFKLTVKNGRLNVFEPVNLALRKAGSITNKAQLWRGRLDVLTEGAPTQLAFYALVDLPDDEELRADADRGIEMIRRAPRVDVEVVESGNLRHFGELAEEVLGH